MGEAYSHLSEEERQVIQIEIGNDTDIWEIGAMLTSAVRPASAGRSSANPWFPSSEKESSGRTGRNG
ncbi:hypothetical protein PL857_07605 [Bifidobacterium adolescentis]|uniref:hypothetical protein n=1 Tax=Bifidobacterium pseudocatenulatum TaxID=28026 RepID=UPI0022E992D1|nr:MULTISPECIES: hypothetical protein [Bifidobacterium]MDB0657584.1 hypothetical protein [Bifidobacterium adolescentis]MDB1345463.1 hypothetical protein [Bifidobacterium adolescentis]MDB1348720.1 hypothetical protein [Bifidobacterium adolescentis]MDB1355511.1 hypothetical protein [Bifidobacterium adolescentis]MDB1358966.1 hypothetical protein [Bifidobacterium adolescentis]